MSDRFYLFVAGKPVPQGSKTAMISKSTGRPIVVDKDQRLPLWRRAITNEAIEKQAEYLQTKPAMVFPLLGPIGMTVTFVMSRPVGHYLPVNGKRAEPELRAEAPKHPATMPDIDKLLRAILDALTDAQVWADDGQVVWVLAKKVYDAGRPGVSIELGEMR